MITEQNAIDIGKAIVLAAKQEKGNNFNNAEARYICNSLVSYALGNLWYDVFTPKLREQFGYSSEEYKNRVWGIIE